MKNLLIAIDQGLYLCVSNGTYFPIVYTKHFNQTTFTSKRSNISFETIEKRLIDKSLDVNYYTYTSASNPTELRELYPELFL